MKTASEEINRPLMGFLAILCVILSLVLRVFYPEHQATYAALMRVGMVLGALWFALPAFGDTAWLDKLTPVIAAGMVLLAIFQKRFVVLAPLLVGVVVLSLVFRPRSPQRPSSRPRRN